VSCGGVEKHERACAAGAVVCPGHSLTVCTGLDSREPTTGLDPRPGSRVAHTDAVFLSPMRVADSPVD
jgi:hypothetical protein